MPGAFLKGNSAFLGSVFNVDQISLPWNVFGAASAQLANRDEFTPDSTVSLSYYRLKHLAVLYIDARLQPSTVPYFGREGETAYIYTGDFEFARQSKTLALVDVSGFLASAPYHFENRVCVRDQKTGAFLDTSRDDVMGTAHINGKLDATRVVLTLPTGFVPHHVYEFSGTLVYELL